MIEILRGQKRPHYAVVRLISNIPGGLNLLQIYRDSDHVRVDYVAIQDAMNKTNNGM